MFFEAIIINVVQCTKNKVLYYKIQNIAVYFYPLLNPFQQLTFLKRFKGFNLLINSDSKIILGQKIHIFNDSTTCTKSFICDNII